MFKTVGNTPYTLRVNLAKTFDYDSEKIRRWLELPLTGNILNRDIRNLLAEDTLAVLEYRKVCGIGNDGSITLDDLYKWFPNIINITTSSENDEEEQQQQQQQQTGGLSIETLFELIEHDRDFIYTKAGVKLLKNRYLHIGEPIQFGMIRLAVTLTKHCPDLLRAAYDMLSCGMIHVSSAIAATEGVEKLSSESVIYPGEACRLMVAEDGYSYELLQQIERICTLTSMGVGVGYGVSNLPRYGKLDRGLIRTGFVSLIKRLNACNFVTIHERKPKVAIYLHVHNDTLFDALELKIPSKAPIENVFVGLMIPDYFMDCVRTDKMWYLFDGHTTVDGKRLSDYYGEKYRRKYTEWVDSKLYTSAHSARYIMERILESLIQSGSPYIIWSDACNVYNNQKQFGTLKTLNLCAEITNYTDAELDSSCTLISCNMAMFKDFPEVLNNLYDIAEQEFHLNYQCSDFGDYSEIARYAYIVGYFSTCFANSLLSPERKRREIGLNPLGVYDMSLMFATDTRPETVCAIVSEALYKGAAQSSCDLYTKTGIKCSMYDKSLFAEGLPQWMLRGITPYSDWTDLQWQMQHGMSNSMLTAQAPTASTSMLTGVTESVTLPMSSFIAKESENGRDTFITYGLMYRCSNRPSLLPVQNDIDSQLAMYTSSLPYVDHSQSAMFSITLNEQEIFDLIVKTFNAKMKTGIYYLLFKQEYPTLDGIKSEDSVVTVVNKNNRKSCASNACDSCSL